MNGFPYDQGMDILEKGSTAAQREHLWQMYCHVYPLFTDETFIGFDDFVKMQTKQPEKKHSKEEILSNVERITNMRFKKEGQ